MQMSAEDQKKYPKLKQYVKDALPQVVCVPIIVSAMDKIGQINRARLTQVLAWGSGPMIRVTILNNAYGEFTPDVHSNEIRLDENLVKEFEAGRGLRNARAGRVYLVGVTLLHELVHWGDDQDGIDRPGEEGEEFERMVYGSVIN
jgi:hypothetical protein